MQDMKSLEDTFEQTLVREEQELLAEIASEGGATEDVATLQKNLRDTKAKYEVYMWHYLNRWSRSSYS